MKRALTLMVLAGARFSADTEAEELTDWFREMGIEP